MSSRRGLLNVWGIPFDSVAGHPSGEAFRVTAFESPALMPASRDMGLLELSLAQHQLALPMAEVSGSIWMLDRADR